jgi:4-diphosphocytidyl-2-C-methyl-D-erythritol kinase
VHVGADLSIRAAQALQRVTACPLGADVHLTKRVPMGGGFGGGSSDAATTLVGLNHLWRTELNIDELATIGRDLGADVPVFVHGRSAWAEGVGERLTPLPLPPRWYLVVDTGVSVPTAELFQAPELTRDARSATIADFVSGNLRGNAFEPVLRRRASAIAAALDRLAEVGEAQLTGTGGGVFAAFVDRERALGAQAALPQGWRSWGARRPRCPRAGAAGWSRASTRRRCGGAWKRANAPVPGTVQQAEAVVSVTLGRRQVVRHRVLIPAFAGSNPAAPATLR